MYGKVFQMLHLLCDILATLQVMIPIRQDLWLHNWDNAILKGRSMNVKLLVALN